MGLLRQAVRRHDGALLDFSPFPWLPEPVVVQVLEALAVAGRDDNDDDKDEHEHEAVTAADLSGNSSISPALVAKLLELYPGITTLTLMHTSRNLPLQALSPVLAGRGGLELRHSELYSAVFDFASQDWDEGPYRGRLSSLPNYAAPTAGTVDRALFLSLRQEAVQADDLPRLPGGGLKWSQLLALPDDPRRRDCPFSYVDISLQDAFLDPLRLSSWLPRLLWYFGTNSATNNDMSRHDHASLGCALALALNVEVSKAST